MSSFSLDVEGLKKVNHKTQCIVFGFIHMSQALLTGSDSNPYFIIPDLIFYIVLGFYFHGESFRFSICTDTMESFIEDNGKMIATDSKSVGYVGKVNLADANARSSGECSIKIIKKALFGIGITSDIKNIYTNKWIWEYPFGNFYYVCTGGTAWKKASNSVQFTYSKLKQGDVIKIEWNTHGLFMCYVNDKKVGEMVFLKDMEYYLCVSANRNLKLKILD